MKKKLVSTIMAAMLAVGCLAGCGNDKPVDASKSTDSSASSQQASSEGTSQAAVDEIPNFNPEGYPIVDEPITLSVLWCIGDSLDLLPFEDLQIVQELEARTGINLEAEIVKKSDFETKVNLLFAAQEYPDIIICSQGSIDYEEYGVTQKILYPLDELMEKYLPEYWERNAMNGIDLDIALRASDDQLYTIPFHRVTSGNVSGNTFFINGDWLETLKLDRPANIEELTDVLRAFKTGDPNGNGKADEIPLALYSSNITDLLYLFGVPGAGSNNMWINDDKKVEFIPTTDAYRKCLEWLHQLYKEELLDVEMFSVDRATHESKLNSLVAGSFPAYRLNSSGFESTIGIYDLWYTEEAKYNWGLAVATNDSVYFSATNEHKEASMRLINYLLEIENQEDFYLGPQNHPEDGWEYTEDGLINDYNYRVGDARSVDMVRFSNSGVAITPADQWNEKYVLGDAEIERAEYQETFLAGKNYVKYSLAHLGLVKLDSETKEKISLIKADMNTAISEYRGKFIKEGITDKSWDDYCKLFKDMNVDYMIQVYQDGVDGLDLVVTPY